LRNIKKNELSDRRGASAAAKAALLEAYRAAKAAAEPTREARQSERLLIAEAREARRAQREQVKLDEQARIETESAERDAASAASARAEIEARDIADKNRVARVLEEEAARKAKRDRRYSDRKARQA